MANDLALYQDKSKYMVLAQPEDLEPHEHVRSEIVRLRIDPNPEAGDVHQMEAAKPASGNYPARPARLALARPAMDRLAAFLGIVEDPNRTTVEKLSPTVWVGRCVAALRLPDGTCIIRTGRYEWDAELRVDEAELAHEEREEVARQKGWRQKGPFNRRKAMLEARKFGTQRAETGARQRAIKALTGLRITLTPEDLKKELVFVRHQVLPTAPAHLLAPINWQAPQQIAAALPAPADDEDDEATVPVTGDEAEAVEGEVQDGDTEPDDIPGAAEAFDGKPAEAAEAAAAAADPEQQADLFGGDAPADPIAEAANALGMNPAPDKRKPQQYRLCELWVHLSARNRTGLMAVAPAEWSEAGAKPLVEKIEGAIK